jgi:hypothetical protein
MSKLLGANWWTTLWGSITTVAAAIAIKPELIAFLPDNYEPTVSGIAVFIFVLSGGVFAHGVKSKNVTGGSVAQTLSGAIAKEGTQSLVDATLKTTIASGEEVTPEMKQIAKT